MARTNSNRLNYIPGYFLILAVIGLGIVWLVFETNYQLLIFVVISYLFVRILYFQNKRLTILMFIVLSLITISTFKQYKQYKHIENKQGEVKGYLLPTSLKVNGELLSFTLVNKHKYRVYYKLKSKAEKQKYSNLLQGYVKVHGKFNNGNYAKNLGGFDKRKYYLMNDYMGEFQASSIQITAIKIQPIKIWIDYLRKQALIRLEKLPNYLKKYLELLILGYGITNNKQDDQIVYQTLGISHLFSLSGLHITIIVDLLNLLLLRLGLWRSTVRNLLVPILTFYYYISGQHLSTWRSIFEYFGKQIKQFSSYDIWGLLVIWQLITNPLRMISFGAILTFMFSLFLKKRKNFAWEFDLYLWLASLPVILYFIGQVSLLQGLWNMFLIPFFTIVVMPGLVAIFILFNCKLLPAFIIQGANQLLYYFEQVLSILAKIKVQVWEVGRLSELIFLVWAVIFIMCSYYFLKKIKRKIIVVCSTLLIILLCSSYINLEYKVTFVDVGQGDSIFVELPFNQGNYLIDTGGKVRILKESWRQTSQISDYTRHLKNFFKLKGITRIDTLILTHGDNDHVGNVLELLTDVKVKQIIYPLGAEKKPNFSRILLIIKQKYPHLKIKGITSINQKIGPFQILWPQTKDGQGDNQHSLVLFSKLGKDSFLFTGDIDADVEKQLTERYPHLKVDVLKVAHHGSRNSTTTNFLEHITPKRAVISAGYHNQFGHPHDEVLTRLKQRKIKIYRTDYQGAVEYRYNIVMRHERWQVVLGGK